MDQLTTDYATNAKWNAYKTGHNNAVFTFFFTGIIFSIVNYLFRLEIFTGTGTVPKIVLTEGNGLTNAGATGKLTAVLTQAQAASLRGNDYRWELNYIFAGFKYRAFTGPLALSSKQNPGVTTTTSFNADVTMAGADGATAITVNVALAGMADVTAETAARAAADLVLQGNIDDEATARSNADTSLQNQIDAIEDSPSETMINNFIASLNATQIDALRALLA